MEQETTQERLARVRTILAAERTFAAWLRTGMAAIVGGLAIIKFIPFRTNLHQLLSHSASVILMLWGLLVIMLNLHSFTSYLGELNKDKIYKVHPLRVLLITVLLIVAVILLIVVVLPVF